MNDLSGLVWIAQSPGASGMYSQFVLLALIFGIFWFLVIRPMRQQQKQRQHIVDNLKRGDKVVTNGGLYGEVAALETTVVYLKVSDNTKIKVARSAIAGLQGEGEGESS